MNKIPENPTAQLLKARNRVANLMTNYGKSAEEARQILIDEGYDYQVAVEATENAVAQPLSQEDQSAAWRNIIFGSLWCFGGIIATLADIGYIFYGAIIFGGIQLVRGLISFGNR